MGASKDLDITIHSKVNPEGLRHSIASLQELVLSSPSACQSAVLANLERVRAILSDTQPYMKNLDEWPIEGVGAAVSALGLVQAEVRAMEDWLCGNTDPGE